MTVAARPTDPHRQQARRLNRPEWLTGSFVTVATLAAVLSIDLGEHRWPELEPARFIMFLGLAIAGAIAMRSVRFGERARADLAVTAALGWVMFASVLAVDPVGATVVAGAILGSYALGAASAAHGFESQEHLWGALAAGLAVPLLVAALLGSPAGGTRWIGLAEEPNGLAVIAALAVVLSVTMGRRHRAAWILTALGVATLLATSAVLPGAAAVAGVAVWLSASWLTALRRAAASIVAIGIAAIALAVFWLPAESLPGDGYNLETINERTGIWSYLLDATSEAPVLGHGARATHDIMDLGAFDQRVHWGPTHGHGAWIELAIAGGWPAAALFVLGLALALGRAERTNDPARSALLVTLAVLALTEPLLREPSSALLVLGVAVAAPTVLPTRRL